MLRLLHGEDFSCVHLLNDIDVSTSGGAMKGSAKYAQWLVAQVPTLRDRVVCHDAAKSLCNDYGQVYEFTWNTLEEIRKELPRARWGLLLSPGYAAAQVAMLIASQTLFDLGSVEVFNTSVARGVERVDLSYHLSVDLVPGGIRRWYAALRDMPIAGSFDEIVGTSRALQAAKMRASRVAAFDIPVLIRGETGTGKELFARAIHQASRRRDRPLVPLHCAALSQTLVESELFGHVKGAFTDAVQDRKGKLADAHGGTLFLDEVGDLPPTTQVKLLRFLESGEYSPVGSNEIRRADVRIIAATHRDLEKGVAEGWFREDLLYRLDAVTVRLPPLRGRGKDVRELACKFLDDFNAKQKERGGNWSAMHFAPGALAVLQRYPWLGNVRQLQRVVQRLAILCPGPEISEEDVAAELVVEPQPAAGRPLAELEAEEFAAYWVAAVEELLARFRQSGSLPAQWECASGASLTEEVILPLLVGCSLELTGQNWNRAGKLFQKSGIERKNKKDRQRYEKYRRLMEAVDSSRVRRIRLGE
ncbi:MAG: sigma-54 dependent transcriptional regulator [Thermoguttaceae bacterium]|nr:sigma-54 dependent transcriptional regulator [Thermoguttaceae bacterium]